MALKTSLVIAGDASSAVAALRDVDAAGGRAEQSAKKLAQTYAETDKAITRLATAQAAAKLEMAAAKAAYSAGELSLTQYNVALLETKTALSLVETQHRSAVTALRQVDQVLGKAPVSAGQAQAGYTNLGRQMQDVAVQLQGGANIGTILAQQGGQVADAVAQMGGRFGGLASFLAGPWGAAIIVGAGVVLNLAESLWKSSDAADEAGASLKKVELGSSGLAEAQSVLGQVFDLTTGKLKNQNEMLILNARLTAINLRADALKEKASSSGTIAKFGDRLGGASLGSIMLDSAKDLVTFSGTRRTDADVARAKDVTKLLADMQSGKVSRESALQRSETLDFSGLAVTRQDLQQAIIDQASSSLKTTAAEMIDKSLNGGQLSSGLLKPDKPQKLKKVADRSAQLANFGDDEASKIANIRAQFSDLPSEVKKSEQAMRQLDDILADIGRKKGLKPDVATALRKEIEATKGAINDSLNKPFDDYLEKSREAAAIDRLLVAGKDDEAEALKIIIGLKQSMGPLDAGQVNAVLATVEAQRRLSMVLRDQRALIAANVRAVTDMRGALEDTIAGALRGRLSAQSIISSLGNSFVNITTQKIVESMFGDTLRQLEEQASGQGGVRKSGEAMASTMDFASTSVRDFATTVQLLNAQIKAGASPVRIANAVGGAVSAGAAIATPDLRTAIYAAIGTTVTGKRNATPDLTGTSALLITMTDSLLHRLGLGLPKAFTESIKAPLAKLETAIPGALAGAFTGSAASKLILGSAGSGAGGAIGGALGTKFLEKPLSKGIEAAFGKGLGSIAGPLGGIVGGLVGGLIGGLFNKAKTGGASVGLLSNGKAGVTGSGGNSDTLKGSTNSLGGSISQGLTQIADRLGASLGQFSVAIGMRNDYYRVSASGSIANATTKHPGSDVLYDGTDQAQAVSIALANAISDGAIKGISAAVQKALKSSTDIDQALAEAMKVSDLELAIGGIGAELGKAFKDIERQASERLRIAKEYGFDIVKVEERNAADRLKLSQKLMAEQVGSLQTLIDNLTSGSLFEGSAIDQRDALKEQIAKVKAEADAGTEGAADKLAGLFEQLNTVSKDAYGTTGGFAADRSTILDQARDTIAKANQRISDAQKASDPALATTNATLDEIADQTSRTLAALGLSNELLAQIAASGGTPNFGSLALLARTS